LKVIEISERLECVSGAIKKAFSEGSINIDHLISELDFIISELQNGDSGAEMEIITSAEPKREIGEIQLRYQDVKAGDYR
jgi:hypothetical protein